MQGSCGEACLLVEHAGGNPGNYVGKDILNPIYRRVYVLFFCQMNWTCPVIIIGASAHCYSAKGVDDMRPYFSASET